MVFLTVVCHINKGELSTSRQGAGSTAEVDGLVQRLHGTAAFKVRVPAIFGITVARFVVRPGKVARHGIAGAGKNMARQRIIVCALVISAIGIRSCKVDFQHTLYHDRHLHLIRMVCPVVECNGEQREAALFVIPIARGAELHIARSVVYHCKGRSIRALYEFFVLVNLERFRRSRYILRAISAVKTHRIGEATVGNQIQVVRHRAGVVTGNQQNGEVRSSLFCRFAVRRIKHALGSRCVVVVCVLVDAIFVASTNIGIGVMAANLCACLALDGCSRIHDSTVTEQSLRGSAI